MRDTEADWHDRMGSGPVQRLRVALERFVSVLDLELPWYVTGYGVADASMTGGL